AVSPPSPRRRRGSPRRAGICRWRCGSPAPGLPPSRTGGAPGRPAGLPRPTPGPPTPRGGGPAGGRASPPCAPRAGGWGGVRGAFRLLGLLEVPDFAPWMLAALLDVSAGDAEEIAERLADAQLVDAVAEDAAGQLRYRCHDLLRLFAAERLAAEETPAARRAALERTLHTYFSRAHTAVRQLRLRPPELPDGA